MSRQSFQLNDQVYEYLLSNSLQEPQILRELRDKTAAHPFGHMQIAPEQGQFFAFLIRALNIKKAIEIGVFTGYSSLSIALAMPADGRLVACDNDAEATQIARQYWQKAGVGKKIEFRLGSAIATLDAMIAEGCAGQFDFAFIDGHKPEYIDYYERLLALIKTGGVIVIDNVLWSGGPADARQQDENTNAIRAFNQHIYQDQRVFISMIPVADGITLALKR